MVTVTIGAGGQGRYADENGAESLAAQTQRELRSLLLSRVAARARQEGRPVRFTAVDPSGSTELLMSPDGSLAVAPAPSAEQPAPVEGVAAPGPRPAARANPTSPPVQAGSAETVSAEGVASEIPAAIPAPAPPRRVAPSASEADPAPARSQPQPVGPPASAAPSAVPAPSAPVGMAPPSSTPQLYPPAPQYQPPTAQQVYPADPRPERPQPPQAVPPTAVQAGYVPAARPVLGPPDSFLASNEAGGPKPTGWRSVAVRLGIKVGPTASERQAWIDERLVAQHWPGPRTVVVLNGKGGAGKTPTAIMLSSFFARLGSGPVVVADGNVTRGTLGWRTEQGAHAATILDMVPEVGRLLSPDARHGDVAAFTHHQTVDQFDVLRSNPLLLSTEQKLTPAQLDGIQQVLIRYYRLIVWDTGNDEGDELWLRLVDRADQIVVATSTRPDHAEAGRLLLQALVNRDGRSAVLARNAVVVVSQADKEEAQPQSLVEGFSALAREVVTIPYDKGMREQWLRSDRLAPATRQAWLHAAAAVARGL